LNGNSPPLTDVADASYVIKPVIGHALKHIYETDAQTLLIPDSASASTKPHWRTNEGQPYHVLDGSTSTYWKSNIVQQGVDQYLEIDFGLPQIVRKIQIQFTDAGNLDFEVQLSSNGNEWNTIEQRNGFTGQSITFNNGLYDALGNNRYLRVYFTGGYTAVSSWICVFCVHLL